MNLATAVATEGDGMALVMLVTVLLSFGVIVMLLFCMFRNASKRDPEMDPLTVEVEAEEKALKAALANAREKKS